MLNGTPTPATTPASTAGGNVGGVLPKVQPPNGPGGQPGSAVAGQGTEQPKAPDQKPPEKKERDAQRFAALSMKEAKLAKEQHAIRAEKDAIAKERAEIEAFRKYREGAKLNPLAYLEAGGVSYEDVTAFVLGDKKPTPDMQVRAVRDELDNWKKQQAEEREKAIAAEKERGKAEMDAVVHGYYSQCVDFVKANAAQYELINLYEAYGEIPKAIEATFAQSKKILTEKEAADIAEQHLRERAERTAATEWWKKRAESPPSQNGTEKRPESAQPRTQPTNTLTNGLTTSTPSFVNAHNTEQDRINRALAKLGG